MISNNKISQIIESIQVAAKPPKFTIDFLRTIGYTSTNDRAIVPLFKKLGFLTDDGIPTIHYDQLRDKTNFKKILASRIRELFAELFTINIEIYNDSEDNIKGAISRVTGGDEESVKRIYNTFKTLCSIADFSQIPVKEKQVEATVKEQKQEQLNSPDQPVKIGTDFHYNIQIHLPATTEISVYNAIFKSLKDNLLM
jgi:cation transport regulator ChaB